MTDTERLNYLLLKSGEDFRFHLDQILGDYDGDDDQQYLESARDAIDGAIRRDSATEEVEFQTDQGDGYCYKCRRGHTECRCNRISLELETAIANLGAEIAMATNALPSRRSAGVMDAFKKVQVEAGAVHRD